LEIITCKTVEIGKRGEYHPCIKNPIKKIPTINFHQKMSQQRIDIQTSLPQALVSFKKYMPPPLPYFKVNICPLPLRINIFRLFVILSLTQLYRYTPEIFLFSTATFKYKYRAPLRRIGQEYSAKVAFFIFQSLKRIQPLPVCAGFFICIRNSLVRPCVTMPS
jgi:hypothetical protein